MGSWGTFNVPSAGAYPSPRGNMVGAYDNTNQIFYLFGGVGFDDSHTLGVLNDIWSFNVDSGLFTWIGGGSDLLNGQIAKYGTKDVPSSISVIGGRQNGGMFFYNSALYIFGGNGYDNVGTTGYLCDMWIFDLLSLNKTWISGSSSANQKSSYGPMGVSSKTYNPSGRSNFAYKYDINSKMFYVFGGFGYDSNGNLGIFVK